MRSTDSWFVYGSVGDSTRGGSLVTTGVGEGTGVAVTPETKSEKVDPTAPTTVPIPPAPTYRTPTATARTPTASASRPTSGIPRLRWMGVWTESRPGAGARGRTLTGAGRPLDGGRGRTCVGRDVRRLVIGRIVARRSARRFERGQRAADLRIATHVGPTRCVVLWRGRACRRRARSRSLSAGPRPTDRTGSRRTIDRVSSHAPRILPATEEAAVAAGVAVAPAHQRAVRRSAWAPSRA